MKIRFQIDPDRLTLNDLIAIEEKSDSPLFMRGFLSRFVIDDKGEYIDPEEALDVVGNLTITEIADAVSNFSEESVKLQEKLLPKVKGSQ